MKVCIEFNIGNDAFGTTHNERVEAIGDTLTDIRDRLGLWRNFADETGNCTQGAMAIRDTNGNSIGFLKVQA